MDEIICRLFGMNGMSRFMAVSSVCFCTCSGAVCAGSLRTWCGASGEQDWSNASNWKENVVPAGDDSAYFPSTAAASVSGTGKRYYSFKIKPPSGFTGKILTTNELWSNDGVVSTYQNRSFRPTLELEVADGATWTVEGNGCVVATEGLAARLSPGFAGEIEVRAGIEFLPPVSLLPPVRITGAGTLVVPSGFDMSLTEAFSGTVVMPESGTATGATVATFRNASLRMEDGATLSFDSSSLAMRQTVEIDSFTDAPGKWTFNGTAWAEGNLPSGPFNRAPPYVKDGELYLTDEPAQVHTVWYTNRTFRLTDDWGMSFTYWPELPSDTRITKEERTDGNTRTQTLSGYFGILFQRTSPTNCGEHSSGGYDLLANDSYGFLIDLYRHDPEAKVMWVAESNYGSFRSVYESEIGIDLNRKMDIRATMIRGLMTVTLVQDGKSVTFTHSFAKALETMLVGGCYVGFAGSTHWWGDNSSVPWVRNRISNFSGWYRDETGGPGWQPIENISDFDISDSSKWNGGKAIWIDNVKTDRSDQLFTSDGVQLTDAAYSNTAYILSKSYPPKRSEPLLFSYRFKTADPNWTDKADGVITFFFGSNFANSQNNGGNLTISAFGNYGKGLDWIWDVNGGSATDFTYSFHADSRKSLGYSDIFGSYTHSDVAAMKPPEKDISADIIWNPNGTFKTFTTIADRDRTGGGRCGSLTYTGISDKDNYAVFTNRTDWSIGVKALCRNKACAAITMTELSIKRLAAAVGGNLESLEIPAGASCAIKTGDAVVGQTLPVVSISSLDLGDGSTLTISPESSETIAEIDHVVSSGGTLSAGSGASVRLCGQLEITSSPDSVGLALTGDVTLGESLSISVPESWKNGDGDRVAVDASGISGALSVDPADVTVSCNGTVINAEKCRVSVSDNRLLLNFDRGFVILFR